MQILCEHTVNYTLEFLKFVCHLRSFRITGLADCPSTSRIHWISCSISYYNKLLFFILMVHPQKFNPPLDVSFLGTHIDDHYAILIKIDQLR